MEYQNTCSVLDYACSVSVYVTCCKTTYHVIWLQNVISELGITITILELLEMCYDISAAVTFSLNTGSSSHSRHIDIIFGREKMMESIVSIEHKPTGLILGELL